MKNILIQAYNSMSQKDQQELSYAGFGKTGAEFADAVIETVLSGPIINDQGLTESISIHWTAKDVEQIALTMGKQLSTQDISDVLDYLYFSQDPKILIDAGLVSDAIAKVAEFKE